MNGYAKDEWPLTQQGVIDWERVFDDEEVGLVPMIMMANTPFVLKECTTLLIQQLFSREQDTMNRMKHILALEKIIPDEHDRAPNKYALDLMRTKIISRMEKIKNDRILASKLYLARKEQASKERRSSPEPD